jgi:hypothetical protein
VEVEESGTFFGEPMKTLSALILAACLCSSLYVVGCETSHTESDKPGMLGGEKHEDTSTSHTESKTP